MHVRTTLSAAVGAVLVAGLVGASPALAAAPANDTAGGAVDIQSLPFSATVDVSQATTDADDAALNAQCGAPVTNNSVWYTFTPGSGVEGIVVNVSDSDFSAGALIAEPDGAGGWVVDACGPGATGTPVVEGVTYRILAFSDTPGAPAETLQISVDTATVPAVELTVNPKGKVDRQGNALISGTYTCSGGDFFSLSSSLKQSVGRFAVLGDGYYDGDCDGSSHPWSAFVVPYNGKFAGGKAASFTYAFSCGVISCVDTYQEQFVKLSK
jgi:hypothetical protein